MTSSRVLLIIAIAVVGAVVCAWQVRRALREPLERDAITAAARARVGLAPPAPDNEAGTDLGAQDECELIYSMPAYTGDELQGRLDQLRQAIREQQEDQQ